MLSTSISVTRACLVFALVSFAALLPARGFAQASRQAVVRVQLSGAERAALGDADLTVSRADVGAILLGRTDGGGRHTFVVDVVPSLYTLTVRKLGYRRVTLPLALSVGDTLDVRETLERLPAAELPEVRVEARGRNYFLDSAEIRESRRPIRNALDALLKLRPDMLGDRARCRSEPVDNVWINGRRILWLAGVDRSFVPSTVYLPGAPVVRQPRKLTNEPAIVDTVLASVRVEHIAEIRFVNCWDTSMPQIGTNRALFIVLRPGVAWDWKYGSHAVPRR